MNDVKFEHTLKTMNAQRDSLNTELGVFTMQNILEQSTKAQKSKLVEAFPEWFYVGKTAGEKLVKLRSKPKEVKPAVKQAPELATTESKTQDLPDKLGVITEAGDTIVYGKYLFERGTEAAAKADAYSMLNAKGSLTTYLSAIFPKTTPFGVQLEILKAEPSNISKQLLAKNMKTKARMYPWSIYTVLRVTGKRANDWIAKLNDKARVHVPDIG